MQSKLPMATISEVTLQAKTNAPEGQVGPGNFLLPVQGSFQAFFSRGMLAIKHHTAIEKMDLADVGYINQGEQVLRPHQGLGFFAGFPLGGGQGAFFVFHETGG